MNPRISFHGGVGTVTGSRHLLQTEHVSMLVDAGLFQGMKKLRKKNWASPGFSVSSIDYLLLTHAHIDHSGYLPRLVKNGLSCPVLCTEATHDLAHLLLLDSAKIQEEDARWANKKGFSKHKPALPLYSSEDAQKALELLKPVKYDEWVELAKDVRVRFVNAGHILGAAMVEAHVDSERGPIRVVFSGDVGRYGAPLHSDPDPLPDCHFLVLESTYGNRAHSSEPMENQIRDAVIRCIDRNGTVLIPSFAVGRSQLITLILRQLITSGRLPDVSIHIDSPMAVNATKLYSKHIDDLSLDDTLVDDGRSRLFPEKVQFHRTVDESKKLNKLPGPRIVISSSGMLTAGRVLHHLKRLLADKRNLIMLVGYQAAGTRGRKMIDGADTIRVHGDDVPVRAEFISVGGLSAHADKNELKRFVESAGGPKEQPDTVFITHGETRSATALAEELHESLGTRTFIPKLHDEYDLVDLLEG